MLDKKNAPILVTGGSGFAGSHLIELLISEGYSNIHSTSFSKKNSFISNILPSLNVHSLDLTSFEDTKTLLKDLKPVQIYHLAAFSTTANSYEKTTTTMKNNMLLQWSLLESIRIENPSCRLLVVGSGQEYDFYRASDPSRIDESCALGPINPYGVSKVEQDLLALSYYYTFHLDIVRVRPFNHTGERQTSDFAVPEFARQIVEIEKGKMDEIKVGNLDVIRDMSDVKDVVKAYLIAMEKGKAGEVYNIGSGTGVKMAEVLSILTSLSKSKIKVAVDHNKIRPLDLPLIIANSNKIQALGWRPEITLLNTLTRVLNYWRNL